MNRVQIRPLSVNEAFKGKKYRTDKYNTYKNALQWLLPKDIEVGRGMLRLTMIVGYTSQRSDIDNFVKPFVDVLQQRYGFNDSQIYELVVRKVVVDSDPYIDFEIINLDEAIQ